MGDKTVVKGSAFDICSKEHFRYLKGIAILFVLIGHIGNYSGKTWFTPLGGIGVAIFLFCSGFGLMASYYQKGLKSFWKNKLLSIYLPYLLVEIIASFILRRNPVDIILDLAFIKVQNPLGWYMQYLLCCYFLFWLACKYIENKKIRFMFWSVVAVLSFFLFSNLRGEQAVSFLSGLIYSEYRNNNIDNVKNNSGGQCRAEYQTVFQWNLACCACCIPVSIEAVSSDSWNEQ